MQTAQPAEGAGALTSRKRVRFGRIHADHVTFDEAVNRVEQMVRAGRGGYILTPNVDHVVLAETDDALCRAYAEADLALVDGMPLLWLSRSLGHPLPEKISGSDLMLPLLRRAALRSWRIYLLGGEPGVGELAASRLVREIPGLQIVGVDAPPYGFDGDRDLEQRVLNTVVAARPDLVFLALGCPKQELCAHRWRSVVAPAVLLGIGAGLDFLAGKVRRAPAWMSQAGLEWAYRLRQEPLRLAKRYLWRDLRIVPIVWRMLRGPADRRAFYVW